MGDIKFDINRSVFLFDQFYQDSIDIVVKDLMALDAEDGEIFLFVNSFGGGVGVLSALIDVMDVCKNPIHTIALGTAMSAGAMVVSHKNKPDAKRFATKNTDFMYHSMQGWGYGSIEDREDQLKRAKEKNTILVKELALNSNLTYDELNDKMKTDWYLNTEETHSYGLIDQIVSGVLENLEYVVTNEAASAERNTNESAVKFLETYKNMEKMKIGKKDKQSVQQINNEDNMAIETPEAGTPTLDSMAKSLEALTKKIALTEASHNTEVTALTEKLTASEQLRTVAEAGNVAAQIKTFSEQTGRLLAAMKGTVKPEIIKEVNEALALSGEKTIETVLLEGNIIELMISAFSNTCVKEQLSASIITDTYVNTVPTKKIESTPEQSIAPSLISRRKKVK